MIFLVFDLADDAHLFVLLPSQASLFVLFDIVFQVDMVLDARKYLVVLISHPRLLSYLVDQWQNSFAPQQETRWLLALLCARNPKLFATGLTFAERC